MAPASLLFISSLLLTWSLASSLASSSDHKVLKLPVHHKRHPRTDLAVRSHFNASLENYLPGFGYFATVGIGTPYQVLELFLSTGESDTWLFQAGECLRASSGPCLGHSFDPTKSSTYKYLGSEYGLFNITAGGDGAFVSGPYFSDQFIIGGTIVKDFTMALIDKAEGIDRAGILGLGLDRYETLVKNGQDKYPNLLDSLLDQSLVSSKSYSIYLDDIAASKGSILFGGYDLAGFYGDLIMLPIQPNPYTAKKDSFYVSLTGFGYSMDGETIMFSSKHDRYPLAVWLDPESEFIVLPIEFFEPFIALFNLKPLGTGKTAKYQTYQVDCAQAALTGSGFGAIVFSFGSNDGPLIKVALEEMIVPSYNPDTGMQNLDPNGKPICSFGILASSPGGTSTLGQTFIRSAYALYDLDNLAVGLAQAKFGVGSSQVVEYKGDGTDTRIVTDVNEPTAVPVNLLASSYTDSFPKTPKSTVIPTTFVASYPTNARPASVLASTLIPDLGLPTNQGGKPQNTGGGGRNSSTNDDSSSNSHLAVEIAVPIVVVVVLFVAGVGYLVWRRRRASRKGQSSDNGEGGSSARNSGWRESDQTKSTLSSYTGRGSGGMSSSPDMSTSYRNEFVPLHLRAEMNSLHSPSELDVTGAEISELPGSPLAKNQTNAHDTGD